MHMAMARERAGCRFKLAVHRSGAALSALTVPVMAWVVHVVASCSQSQSPGHGPGKWGPCARSWGRDGPCKGTCMTRGPVRLREHTGPQPRTLGHPRRYVTAPCAVQQTHTDGVQYRHRDAPSSVCIGIPPTYGVIPPHTKAGCYSKCKIGGIEKCQRLVVLRATKLLSLLRDDWLDEREKVVP